MKIVVLDGYCINPGDLTWDRLHALGDAKVHDRTEPSQLLERCAGAAAVLVGKLSLTREVIAALPDLRYIGVLATGYNTVDTAAARERGIVVTNIPTYGTESVAQHTIALLLEIANRVAEHAASVERGDWSHSADWSYTVAPLRELAGKTMGIVGFGRIGQQTARIAAALGMQILAYDHHMHEGPDDFAFRWYSLRGLLEESDVVSLHCPLVAETKGIVNAQTLKRMKRGAILLNTSRGGLVEEAALADALHRGHLAAAGLDVLMEEPPLSGSPLLMAKNCWITPHIAWATKEARARLLAVAVENLKMWIEGQPQNVVISG